LRSSAECAPAPRPTRLRIRPASRRIARPHSLSIAGNSPRTACRGLGTAASPQTASGRTAGNTTVRAERLVRSYFERLQPLGVALQRRLPMIAEMAFAPVRTELRFGMTIATVAELAHLAVHLPMLERSAHRTPQRAFEHPLRAVSARLRRGN